MPAPMGQMGDIKHVAKTMKVHVDYIYIGNNCGLVKCFGTMVQIYCTHNLLTFCRKGHVSANRAEDLKQLLRLLLLQISTRAVWV